MHKITINELILKKGYDKHIQDFYNTEYRFFLALLYIQAPTPNLQIARVDVASNLDRSDYVAHLAEGNTRVCQDKGFQLDLDINTPVLISLLLIKDAQPVLRAKELRRRWGQETIHTWLQKSEISNATKLIEINCSPILLAYNSSFTLENDIVKLQLSIKN